MINTEQIVMVAGKNATIVKLHASYGMHGMHSYSCITSEVCFWLDVCSTDVNGRKTKNFSTQASQENFMLYLGDSDVKQELLMHM